VTATAAAILADRGLLDYGDKVARHWPEFAQSGKANVTIAHLLSHQAGLPGFVESTTIEDQFDWSGCVAKLARQKPA